MTLPDDVYNFIRLTQDEEIELFRRYREEGDLKARDKVVKCYVRYGLMVARRILGSAPSDEELLSLVGSALMHAVGSKFNPTKSRFSTYANFHIRRECYSEFNFSMPVRITSRAFSRMSKAGCRPERISLNLNGNSTQLNNMERGFDSGRMRDQNSPEMATWPDSVVDSLREALTTEDNIDLDRDKIEAALNEGMKQLTPRERETIHGKYWDDEVFEQAGKRMGCSREWARRIHDSGIAKLAKHLQKTLGLKK